MQYLITHTTGTGKWDDGNYSGSHFFTLIGDLGETGSHDCPALRPRGKTASCTFEDGTNIGKLLRMRIKNTSGNNWSFTRLFVAVNGDLRGSRTTRKTISSHRTFTFDLVNSGKKDFRQVLLTCCTVLVG